jgi:AcrR family transcriptional regulator
MDDVTTRLDRSAWLETARSVLIRSGHNAVKIDRLANTLNVTRGSFYWHFRNRQDLLDSLVADWETNNSVAILGALRQAGAPLERLRALARVWIDETAYSPAYDSALRDWARVSASVQKAVRKVDQARIAALVSLFEDAGYRGTESLVRARVTYFHQVGYYAMRVKETRTDREQLLNMYLKVLLGSPG